MTDNKNRKISGKILRNGKKGAEMNKEEIFKILSDETNFEILMALFSRNELILSELDAIIAKSRSTIHRHIQDLISSGFILESKEKVIKGPIPAKYYKLNFKKFVSIPSLSMDQVQSLSEVERIKIYSQIKQTYYTMITFLSKILVKIQTFLQKLTPENSTNFEEMLNFNDPRFFATLNLLTEPQKTLYLRRFQEFSQSFMQEIMEKNMFDPQDPFKDPKPFLLTTLLAPIQSLFKNE
ncbi:MAG: winged helix-turn-helix domain-containing protein [Promethearchaeota archaeon]